MKAILRQLITDSYERRLPDLAPRETFLQNIPFKANVITGMRRTGKTWFCFQRMKELLAAGIEHNQLLYLNFEDDRILNFRVEDFQSILDIYYGLFPSNRDKDCYFFLDEIQRVPQ